MSKIARDDDGEKAFVGHQGAVQNVSYTDTPAQSTVFAERTIVYLISDSDCYFLVGEDPTATSSNGTMLAASIGMHWAIRAGERISFIRKSENGACNITSLS